MPTACYLPYGDTRRFSPLVVDYLDEAPALSGLYSFPANQSGLLAAIEARKQFPVDRQTLYDVLYSQYRHLPLEENVEQNIRLLKDDNTFTICTAHQPNLATGYLYFVYKILHAIRLAARLKELYPKYNFVPVYYMGSEDADLDELGTFRFGDKKFVWDAAGQTGAVGRMKTESLFPLLQELFSMLGPPGPNWEALQVLLRQSYTTHATIAEATLHLVHSLFGKYGLIVLEPDNAAFKKAFLPVMEEDLFSHTASNLVEETIRDLSEKNYKAQAHPRQINLFYLKDNLRERIEKTAGQWHVLGTEIRWNEQELRDELHQHPERFSPNVMLRPAFQETILPDVAFIGGGAEVAYWLQLQSLFAHHKVFFPVVMLRQSAMWISEKSNKLLQKTGLSLAQLFAPEDEATKHYVAAHSERDWTTQQESLQLNAMAAALQAKAKAADSTLARSAEAAITRMKRQLEVLEQKMLRAEKRRLHTGLEQLARLRSELFPGGGLQERVENFMPYFLQYGPSFFDELLNAIDPLRNEFLVLTDSGAHIQ